MRYDLVTTITNQKPKIGHFFTLTPNESSNCQLIETARLRVTTMITTKTFKNEEEAKKHITKEKHKVGAVAFLADDIQRTPKMSNILERIRYLGVQIKDIQQSWKAISLNTTRIHCYGCDSKITQLHDKVIESQETACDCPVCGAADYILAKTTRNKIDSLNSQIKNYKDEYKILEQAAFEEQIKSEHEVEWMIGCWLPEYKFIYDFH